MLEKVGSLDDKEEMARLAGEAEGRKSSVWIKSWCPQRGFSCLAFISMSLMCHIVRVSRKGNVPTPSLCQVMQISWQKFTKISKNSGA